MRQETKSFISFGKAESGLIFDESHHAQYPLAYYHMVNGQGLETKENRTYFTFVYEGEAHLIIENGLQSIMPKDTYFAHHGKFCLNGLYKAIVIEIHTDKGEYAKSNYTAYTTIGGKVEDTGRLKYIDGWH